MSPKQLAMVIDFDNVNKLFVMTYLEVDGEEKRIIFQVKLDPDSFEKFQMDIVRMNKDYKLALAKQHMAEQEEKKQEQPAEETQPESVPEGENGV